MAEEIVLTVPVITTQTTTSYKFKGLTLDRERQLFVLLVRGTNGDIIEAKREGAAALTIMQAINTNNGSVTTLQKRALQWLQTQPEGAALVGPIATTPD